MKRHRIYSYSAAALISCCIFAGSAQAQSNRRNMQVNRQNAQSHSVLGQSANTTTDKASKKSKQKELKANTEPKDSTALFQGLSVSYDLAGTIMKAVGDYGQYEAALRVNLKDRYFPILEVGLGEGQHGPDDVSGISIKTSAPYFRLGCDMNLSKNKHDDYRVLLGARYGFTNFKQEISGTITDPTWGGPVAYAPAQESASFHWADIVFGIDAKMWGPVRLGWSFRYRQKLSASELDGQELWYVPGFGKSGNKLSGTFNISVELHRKKSPQIVLPL